MWVGGAQRCGWGLNWVCPGRAWVDLWDVWQERGRSLSWWWVGLCTGSGWGWVMWVGLGNGNRAVFWKWEGLGVVGGVVC